MHVREIFRASFLIITLSYFPAGCENGCSGHGQCTLEEGLYKCVCIKGWAGSDCSIPLEMECDDDVDNDHGRFFPLILSLRFIDQTREIASTPFHLPPEFRPALTNIGLVVAKRGILKFRIRCKNTFDTQLSCFIACHVCGTLTRDLHRE